MFKRSENFTCAIFIVITFARMTVRHFEYTKMADASNFLIKISSFRENFKEIHKVRRIFFKIVLIGNDNGNAREIFTVTESGQIS